MDENKLTELFRDAVADAPPAAFDQRDIVAASERQRLRQRNAIVGGSALGVALLASATVLGVALWSGSDGSRESATAAAPNSGVSARNGDVPPNEVPNEDSSQSPRAADGDQDKGFSVESPEQGGISTGNAGPQGPGSTSSGCEQADRELAAALAGELPAAPSVDQALRVDVGCPVGSLGAAYQVSESGRRGVVSVVLLPEGVRFSSPYLKPEAAVIREAVTRDGRWLVVVSRAESGSTEPPYRDVLQGVADRIAAGY